MRAEPNKIETMSNWMPFMFDLFQHLCIVSYMGVLSHIDSIPSDYFFFILFNWFTVIKCMVTVSWSGAFVFIRICHTEVNVNSTFQSLHASTYASDRINEFRKNWERGMREKWKIWFIGRSTEAILFSLISSVRFMRYTDTRVCNALPTRQTARGSAA